GKGWIEDPAWSARVPVTFVRHKSNTGNYDEGVRLIDVDGNATADFVRAYDTCGVVNKDRWMDNDSFKDLLTEIDNGVGGVTTLSYVSSATIDNHQIGAPTGSTSKLRYVIPVLASSTRSDGQTGEGHRLTTTYNYR